MLAEAVASPSVPARSSVDAHGCENNVTGLHLAITNLSLLSLPEYTQLPNISLPELPAYTPGSARQSQRREQSEHVYHLLNGAKRPWLTLRVMSWAPTAKNLPLFIEGGTITGLVEVNLEKTDNIKQVAVYFKGQVISSSVDIKTFTELTKVVFDASNNPAARKLKGNYRWLFSLPIEGQINPGADIARQLHISGNEALPPTFGGRGAQSDIDYHLGVCVKRSGLFADESVLDTNLVYVPLSVPDEPSPLRQQAYAEGGSVLGPEIDPDGWKSFADVDLKGTLFKSRSVSVSCSLALATPLTYTRSSVIPCYLMLRSNDQEALDVLSNPNAPTLQIRRKVKSHVGIDNMNGSFFTSKYTGPEILSKAVWKSASTTIHEDGTQLKAMYGELGLPGNLTPSFSFGEFEIKYMVDLLPFSITGFVPDRKTRLSRTEVQIVTGFSRGPAPRAYLPPGYGPTSGEVPSRR